MDVRSDHDLLEDYASRGTEEAFAELVTRYIALVYSTALRRLNDSHLAEDVAQATFVLLARKARSIHRRIIVAGWLHRTAGFISGDLLKAQVRRKKREETSALPEGTESETVPWAEAGPQLEEALSRLPDLDRIAIVLRFFEEKSLREIGATLDISEDTARKRIDRAVEKLRRYLHRKNGILVSSEFVIHHLTMPDTEIPIGLITRATTVALAGGSAVTARVMELVAAALKAMFASALKRILGTAGVLAVLVVAMVELCEVELTPPADVVIAHHLKASGFQDLQLHPASQRNAGSACMKCHRSAKDSLISAIVVKGTWEEPSSGKIGTLEWTMAGPDRKLEVIRDDQHGETFRGITPQGAWSFDRDSGFKALTGESTEAVVRELDYLLTPMATPSGDRIKNTRYAGQKSYCLIEDRDGFSIESYFSKKDGLRMAVLYRKSDGTEVSSICFEEYSRYGDAFAPARIRRKSEKSEEWVKVTSMEVNEVPLSRFDPPIRDRRSRRIVPGDQ